MTYFTVAELSVLSSKWW